MKEKKGCKSWNKGLTKDNDERIRKIGEKARGKILTIETREKISAAKKGKPTTFDQSLDKNPNWLGGKSFEPYDLGFNKRFRNQIRERDNQVCMACGIHREKLSKSLSIHHVDYNKELSIPQNCISLCSNCHMKTNFNRENWIPFFQSILKKQYGYEYENNKPVIELKQEV